MIEGEESKTVTQVVQELTGDSAITAQVIRSQLVLFRDEVEIGRMVWNPVMTSRQKKRILQASSK